MLLAPWCWDRCWGVLAVYVVAPWVTKTVQGSFNRLREVSMGLVEIVLIVLVIAAIAGGLGVSPLLWLLLLVALVVLLTGGGFGYRRGGRI